MNCPNCGLANPDSAKFCGNCGTALDGAPSPQSSPYGDQSQYQVPPLPYQASGPYGAPNTATSGGSTIAKRIGLGCLIAIVIFLFFGLSCTRACFRMGHRRVYIQRRY
jgi:uncharacterized membrane protein YvbJ